MIGYMTFVQGIVIFRCTHFLNFIFMCSPVYFVGLIYRLLVLVSSTLYVAGECHLCYAGVWETTSHMTFLWDSFRSSMLKALPVFPVCKVKLPIVIKQGYFHHSVDTEHGNCSAGHPRIFP